MADLITMSPARPQTRRTCALLFCGVAIAVFAGCDTATRPVNADNATDSGFWVGSAIAGEGTELASIDVVVGDMTGPVGSAFASGVANQRAGHPAIIAVLEPNVPVKPSTLLVNRVTTTGQKSSIQFFGPVQQGVSQAVVDSVAEKILPRERAEKLVIVVSVFIHPLAEDKDKLFQYNYEATKAALRRAMAREPTVEEVERSRRRD